jgi:enamine deaminase RidA (YjgF/YER057c/UK114 family)
MREVTSQNSARDQVVVSRRIDHPNHTEWYLTGLPAADKPGANVVSEVFEALAGFVAEQRISVMLEKVYALRQSREEILQQRMKALLREGLETNVPVTFLQGTPASGEAFGGVQLWGVTPRPGAGERIEAVEWPGQIRGREWIGHDFRQLVVASIDGLAEVESHGALRRDSAPDQARRMLERATAALSARGYSFRQVARTWIYLSRVLDWYSDFNAVRNAHFAAAGLPTNAAADGLSVFPASTGIQAYSDAEECVMDLLAIDAGTAGNFTVRPILRSGRQEEAFSYGSAFSRAMVIDWTDYKTIHISGTASIDAQGHSTHRGDAAAQFRETMINIAALLEQEGATLSNICQGTLFAKSAEVAATCRDLARELDLTAMPLIGVVADVCRPELLVEIEAVAIV